MKMSSKITVGEHHLLIIVPLCSTQAFYTICIFQGRQSYLGKFGLLEVKSTSPIIALLTFQHLLSPVRVIAYMKHFYFFNFKNLFIYLFIYLFLAALGIRCCAWAFSSCGKWGLIFVVVRGLLIAVASLVAEHRLQVHGLQQLWHVGSVVVAGRLQSADSVVVAHGLSCSAACGIFPDQGSNPCPLHWQADS